MDTRSAVVVTAEERLAGSRISKGLLCASRDSLATVTTKRVLRHLNTPSSIIPSIRLLRQRSSKTTSSTVYINTTTSGRQHLSLISLPLPFMSAVYDITSDHFTSLFYDPTMPSTAVFSL
jgi:hypothetical protein